MKMKTSPAVRLLFAIVFWLSLWQIAAAQLAKPLLLPSPFQVLSRLFELMLSGDFWLFTALSLLRIAAGTAAAIVLGILLAVLCCRFSLADALFSPLLTAVKATPVASFVILVLVWADRNYVPVLISALMVLPVIWANVYAGIKGTDSQLLELAKVYRLPPLRVLRRIYIPSVLPHFRAACRAALGLGWKAGIAAEVLTVPKASMGRMIYESKLYLQTTDLFAWTLAVIMLSLLIEKLMLWLMEGRRKDA